MWGMQSDLYSPDVFGGKVTDDTLCDLSWATPEHHWSVDVLKHTISHSPLHVPFVSAP